MIEKTETKKAIKELTILLMNYARTLATLALVGCQSWEVQNDLIRRGYNVDVGVVEYNQTKDNKKKKIQLEVDFVVNRGNIKYYIQSALTLNSEEKREQELNSLKRIDDSFKKIVVVKDDIIPRYDEQGIYYIGVKDFLLADNIFKN